MSKVQILSADVVAKIAAGEVVERPSSVVKELMENSIDANATSIEVRLKEAGKTLIQIKDNGDGISREDLEKIFSRHATSKIKSADDLFDIHTLGFRGEALYSIAAISDVTLKTKTKDSNDAWEIHLRGLERIDIKPCALASHGTQIEIKELFYNTPARKKFLKASSTEMHQIINTFVPYTLLYKNFRFKLAHQDKDIIDVSASDQLTSRIAHILNLDEKHLIEKDLNLSDRKMSIKVILGDINIKRTQRDLQFLFVNNRPVYNKNIFYHMNQVYRLIMAPDEFPFFSIYLEVPAEDVDVNIHPTKREVKIRNEREICTILRSLVEDSLMKKSDIKQVGATSLPSNFEQSFRYQSPTSSFETKTPDNLFDSGAFQYPETANKDYAYPRAGQSSQGFFIPSNSPFHKSQNNIQSKLENARYIGSFLHKYLLFGSGHSLLLIDQHAAAERITYELLIRHMQKGDIEIQPLLSPVLIDVSPQEMCIWEDLQDEFKKVGLETTKFDDQTIAIHTQPVLLEDVEKTARYILAGEKITTADHDQIARRACRSSIMSGDKLNGEKAEFLREQLLQTLDPFTCPHGRPTVIEITEDFLNKQFLRC